MNSIVMFIIAMLHFLLMFLFPGHDNTAMILANIWIVGAVLSSKM